MLQYGLIGKTLKHSFSKDYFTKKFRSYGLNDVSYENFELANIQELNQLVETNEDLVGFNVTIPYKQEIIPFLGQVDSTAEFVGAVNTVKVERKLFSTELIGYNTDVIGFEQAYSSFLKSGTTALVFGTGGASLAVEYVLLKYGIKPIFIGRTQTKRNYLTYTDLSQEIIQSAELLINCTPVGSYPNSNEVLPIPYSFVSSQHKAIDLIYNPEKTPFLLHCEQQGARIKNGLDMLVLQAEAAWEIWTQ